MKKILAAISLVFIFFLSCDASAAIQSSNSPLNFNEALYAVILNQQDTNQVAHVLTDQTGEVWISQNDLMQWRINLPPIQGQDYLGVQYFRLRDLHGGTNLKFDRTLGKIFIDFPSKIFKPSSLDFSNNEIIIPERSPTVGTFLNYDVFFQKVNTASSTVQPLTNAGFEWGIFNGFGSIINTANLQNIAGADDATQKNKFTRLNSAWTYDNPAKMTTLVVGDSISNSGMWGTAVSFGGVQFGNNFATQPNFQKMPLPSAKGEAVVPSVVDVYVNDALIGDRDVSAGPFTITNIPVTDGYGNIKLVVKDSLGRQQLVDVPYYASSNLIKQKLNDYSFSAGFIRKNYNVNSYDYGRFVFSGTDTYGMTDNVNTQIHMELSRNIQNLGLGANFIALKYFDIGTAVAASRNTDIHRNGILVMGRIGHSSTDINYGIVSRYTDQNYSPLASSIYEQPNSSDLHNRVRWQHMAYVGFPRVFGGSLGVNYSRTSNWLNNNVNLLTADYTHTVFNRVSASITGTTNLGGATKTKRVYLSLNFTLDDINVGVSANQDYLTHDQQALTTITKPLPQGSGYGYRVSAAAGNKNNQFVSGGLDLQNNIGTYRIEAAKYREAKPSYQGSISGAVSVLKSQVFLSRRINNSFGVVRIPDFANIPISLESQEVAKTDRKGYAFIPDLLPYVKNTVSINPRNLPLDTQITTTEIEIIPFYRSGVYKEFDVARSNNALITAKLPNGSYVPTGAGAVVIGQYDELFVGENGAIFLLGLTPDVNNKVKLEWDDTSCEIDVPYRKTNDPLPNLGEFMCHPPDG